MPASTIFAKGIKIGVDTKKKKKSYFQRLFQHDEAIIITDKTESITITKCRS